MIGGTSMLPGFKERLSEELKNALETPRYSALAALKDAIKFHDPPAKANYTAWLGGEGLILILSTRTERTMLLIARWSVCGRHCATS